MSAGLLPYITTSYGDRSFPCGQWIGDGWCHRGPKKPCWVQNDVIFYDPWHSYVVNQPPPMVILVSGMSRPIQRVSNQWNRSKTRSARSSKALVRPNSTGQFNPDREEHLVSSVSHPDIGSPLSLNRFPSNKSQSLLLNGTFLPPNHCLYCSSL